MEVLDRYLKAVGSWLPKAQQADIVSEISEDLRSEIEEKERALGRGLDETELYALLERRGHPMWVAEGYLPPRHLIGPVVLPHYVRALKIAIPCVLAVFLLLGVIFTQFLRDVPPSLTHAGFWVWQCGVWTFAYVGLFTVIFAGVERAQARARATGQWDPRDPNALPGAPVDHEARAKRSLRFYASVDLVVDILVLSCFLGVHPAALPELGIVLTPAWQALHWPIAVALVASIAVAIADAARPSWSRSRLIAHLAVDGFTLAVTGILLAAGPWVDISSAGLLAAKAAFIEKWLNQIWLWVLLIIAAISAARVFQHARRLAAQNPSGPGARRQSAEGA